MLSDRAYKWVMVILFVLITACLAGSVFIPLSAHASPALQVAHPGVTTSPMVPAYHKGHEDEERASAAASSPPVPSTPEDEARTFAWLLAFIFGLPMTIYFVGWCFSKDSL